MSSKTKPEPEKKKQTDIETFLFGKKVGLAPKYLSMKKTQTLKILSF